LGIALIDMPNYRIFPDLTSTHYGIFLAGAGMIAGAVVGGVGDLLAFMRTAFPNRKAQSGPEADYKELPPLPIPPNRPHELPVR
jgi:hypothetical protein